MNIYKNKFVSRFGLMHMIATNLCVWLNVLILETSHEILEAQHHGAGGHHGGGGHGGQNGGSGSGYHNVFLDDAHGGPIDNLVAESATTLPDLTVARHLRNAGKSIPDQLFVYNSRQEIGKKCLQKHCYFFIYCRVLFFYLVG